MLLSGNSSTGTALFEKEVPKIQKVFKNMQHLLTNEAKNLIKQEGVIVDTKDRRNVLQYQKGYGCVFAYNSVGNRDSNQANLVSCAIETCYLEGTSKFKKPISCWLFPIIYNEKMQLDEHSAFFIRYFFYFKVKECNSAIENGKQKNIKLYQFLKEPLIMKIGKRGYNKLEKLAKSLEEKL